MILILSAVEQENSWLRTKLTQTHNTSYGPVHVTRGTFNRHELAIATIGIGKSNAAGISALLLHNLQADLVIMCGCGGAYPGSGLDLGDIAMASQEFYADEGALTPEGFKSMAELDLPLLQHAHNKYFNTFPTSKPLTALAAETLQHGAADRFNQVVTGPFVTVSTCSGTDQRATELENACGGICENMEGAAAAHMCRMFGTPFIELRAISNMVEKRNLHNWDLPGAMQKAQEAVLYLLQHWTPTQLKQQEKACNRT